MKIRLIFVSWCYTIISFSSQAQTTGTYWQQEVNYVIHVELDDQKNLLHGNEAIEYINNSPDDLSFIYFHLWPNAYKNNKTAFAKQQVHFNNFEFHFASKEQRGYIDSLDFKVNGESVKWEYDEEHIDICMLHLKQPLKSGERITISTPFRVKIPHSFSRLGHVGQQYQVTQWYPKPAVYDQKGWHPMPYLNLGEFYSEFGTFDVSITLPANYVIGATGTLQNEEEQRFMDSIASQDWQNALFSYTVEQQLSSARKKTIRYIQENVHDFAWFADKTYRIMNGEVILPNSGRTVKLQALYNSQSFEVWQDIIQYMHDAVYYYSLWIGDYPYDIVTVVDGALSAGSGMEYPTITVLGARDRFALELVTMHEIGHNWFYGILANNERDHSWMDEGINSFYEHRYISTKYPRLRLTEMVAGLVETSSLARWIADRTKISQIPYTDLYRLTYLMIARQNMDQPVNLHADEFTNANYFAMVYQKPVMIFKHLESYLGIEKFDRIMQLFYETWKFKHPQPEDLRRLLERESGKNLEWLFDGLLNTKDKINYKIKSVEKTGDDLRVSVRNKGNINAPFPIAIFRDGTRQEEQWVEGFTSRQTLVFPGHANADHVVIDPDTVTLDIKPGNGRSRTEGLFKRSGTLNVAFPGSVEDPDLNQLFIIPVAGANTNDNLMIGAGFYNRLFPEKEFNYFVMPMYSFGLQKLAGSAEINYNFFPNQLFRRIRLTAIGKSYAGYEKIEPRIEFTFNPRSLKYNPTQKLFFRYSMINTDQQALPLYESNYNVLEGRYSIEKTAGIWQFDFNTGLRNNPGEFLSWENDLRISWRYLRNASIKTRAFFGHFLNGNNISQSFQYGLSGSFDYMMDDVFLDRASISYDFTGFEVQTNLRHGGFRGWVPITSDNWITAINLDVDIPFIGFFNLFADFGFTDNASDMIYDAGIRFSLIRNVLDFYFPLFGDPFAGNSPESFRDITNHARFRLQLNNLNPFNALYK